MKMIFFSGFFILDIIILVLICVVCFVYYCYAKTNDYWKKRNVASKKPVFFFGNLKDVFLQKTSMSSLATTIYHEFEGERYCGWYVVCNPVLILRDLKLIERVLTTDFSYFYDRVIPENLCYKLSNSLPYAKGSTWRTMRYKLNPAFTSFKIKGMFDQILNCSEIIVEGIEEKTRLEGDFDVLPLLFQFSNDVIASCVFGINISTDSVQRLEYLKAVDTFFKLTLPKMVLFSLGLLFPWIVNKLQLQMISKKSENYFINLTKATIKHRKNHNVQRNDFLNLFLSLKEQEESNAINVPSHSEVEDLDLINYTSTSRVLRSTLNEKVFTEDTIAACLYSFLSFGSEYSANTLGYALLELAKAPDIQRRLQEEVDTIVTKHGALTYDSMREMIFLDQIIQETMRLHSVGSPLLRRVTKPYRVPNSDLVLEPGIVVVIPMAAIHRDPQYYPSPLQFDPDRFLNNNYKPSPSFFPFGNGPKICIVRQFAILELKVCLAKIVSRYSFTLSPKTQLPIRNDPISKVPRPIGGIWLSFQSRNEHIG